MAQVTTTAISRDVLDKVRIHLIKTKQPTRSWMDMAALNQIKLDQQKQKDNASKKEKS